MAIAFRPRASPCSIHSRNGSQALTTRSWLPVGGEIGGLKSGVTSLAGFESTRSGVTALAGFESAESVIISLAGFAGPPRPQGPGGRTPLPATLGVRPHL